MKKLGIIIFIMCIFSHLIIKNIFQIKFINEIDELSEKYNISKELVLSIIKVESNFEEKVVSYKGAIGLMQIMPSTAEWILSKTDRNINKYDLYKARDNIEIGMIYYKYLDEKFKGNITNIMIAYNAGASRVYDNSWKDIKETKEYIIKIKIARIFYSYRLFMSNLLLHVTHPTLKL